LGGDGGRAEQLDFRANVSARTLAKAQKQVALVQPFDADYRPFYTQLTRAFLRDTEARGWRSVQVFPDEVLGAHADAVIFLRDDVPERALEHLLARHLPVAVMGYSAHVPYVCTKNEAGVASSTRLLRDTGHRRIAYLGWTVYPDGSYSPRGRGYERVLTEPTGLHEPLALGGDHTSLDAYRAVSKAWSRGVRFDGLVCSTDEAALGALAAFDDLGVRVPAEVWRKGCAANRL
jgi:LacI family transcriptional regulator